MVEEIKKEVKEPDMIEKAEKVVADLKAQLDRQEKIIAQDRLAGRSFAGQAPVVETEEQKQDKEIERMFKDTGMSPLKGFKK